MNIQAAVKGSDQTAQAGLSLSDRTYHIVEISYLQTTKVQTSLISAFVIAFWKVYKLATGEISNFLLVSVTEETCLKLALSETPKTGFLASRPTVSLEGGYGEEGTESERWEDQYHGQ